MPCDPCCKRAIVQARRLCVRQSALPCRPINGTLLQTYWDCWGFDSGAAACLRAMMYHVLQCSAHMYMRRLHAGWCVSVCRGFWEGVQQLCSILATAGTCTGSGSPAWATEWGVVVSDG
jgi:hypothetical protein